MIDKLLNRLCSASAGEELLEVLVNLRPEVGRINSTSDLKKFENTLVLLCCQNKNMAHWKHDSDKMVRQASLERLFEILLDLCKYQMYNAANAKKVGAGLLMR